MRVVFCRTGDIPPFVEEVQRGCYGHLLCLAAIRVRSLVRKECANLAMVFQWARWFAVLQWLLLPAVVGGVGSLDTTCSLSEDQWFRAEDHTASLTRYMQRLQVTQTNACLDLLGASQHVADAFTSQGYPAVSFDIALNPAHDVCSEDGFKALCSLGMQMIEGGLCVCAPPCSLYSAACQSIHQRTRTNPGGNRKVFKVRLAHRIWANMAPGLHLFSAWLCSYKHHPSLCFSTK